MTPDDTLRFTQAIAALCEAFARTPTPTTFAAYRMGLDDLPIAAIETAAGKAIRTCHFMPTPCDLRELSGFASPSNVRAVLAFAALERAVETYGGYKSVLFDDPLMNAAVRNLGGWQRFCETPTEEFEKWLRKDFERVYQALMEGEEINPDATRPHQGILAQSNAILGRRHVSSEPHFVVTGLKPMAGIPLLTGVPKEQRRLGSEQFWIPK